MEFVCERKRCTGCGLCSNVCPKNAISMVESQDTGHFVPQIDSSLCIDCGLCKKGCPSLSEPDRKQEMHTYAAWCEQEEQRKGSSSGGVAANFYENALQLGYYIVGAKLTGTSKLIMDVTDKKEDIEGFKGSKYIQAQAGDVYKSCLQLLDKGEMVVFLGTPCQCAAMNSAGKQYGDRLLLVELICHGTPSQESFRKYVETIESKKRKQVDKVSFRSAYGVELTLSSKGKVLLQNKLTESEYLTAFQNGILHNESCYQCPYANKDRCADITIGDFWKIGQREPFEKPKCKVSVVVVNSEKGDAFVMQMKGLHMEERTYQEAMDGNPNLYRPSTMDQNRDVFWQVYHSEGINKALYSVYKNKLKFRRTKNAVKKKVKAILGK